MFSLAKIIINKSFIKRMSTTTSEYAKHADLFKQLDLQV
jgi:hypothetical protein